MSAIPDVVSLKFGLLGGFAIPQTICAACGHPMVAPAKTLHVTKVSTKQGLALDFPLCQPCANLLAEVDAVEGKRAWRSFLLSIPLGIGVYAGIHTLVGYAKVNWLTLFLVGLAVYTLIYLGLSHWLVASTGGGRSRGRRSACTQRSEDDPVPRGSRRRARRHHAGIQRPHLCACFPERQRDKNPSLA